ncbi:MAG: integrase catalytic domain-containing protein [Opitutaceae bacterium]
MSAPNRVWCADCQGRFKTRDGLYCYPLTVTDGYSRYLLGCQAMSSTAVAEAQPVFARLFGVFGLPERIRTENGGALCHHHARPSVLAVGLVGAAGHPARTHRTGQTPTKRQS